MLQLRIAKISLQIYTECSDTNKKKKKNHLMLTLKNVI